jgi:hypothetical protein
MNSSDLLIRREGQKLISRATDIAKKTDDNSALWRAVQYFLFSNAVPQYSSELIHLAEEIWSSPRTGLTAGGMGLSLCPASLIKVASMLSNKGIYNERRIISEEYIALATTPQVIKQDDLNSPDQYFSGWQYGFQFHISPNGIYRADGAFGQFCIIHPDNNFAVIATSQKTSTERFLELVTKYLINVDETDYSVSQIHLNAYLSELVFPVPELSDGIDGLPHGVYSLEDNELDIRKVHFSENNIKLFFVNGIQDQINIADKEYVYGRSHFIKDLQIHLQEHCTFAARSADGSLILTIYYIETPYVGTYRFQFLGKKLLFTFSINVSMTLKGFTIEGIKVN